MAGQYLKEFERLNTTTDSIHDLGDYKVLIILKDKTNLTRWGDVENAKDIIYISEDLSNYKDLSGRYKGLESLRAIVASGVDKDAETMVGMFMGCRSLKYVSGLEEWDVSGVFNMSCMFSGCRSLEDLSFVKDWDVSNVKDMSEMFSFSALENLSGLEMWDVSGTERLAEMFEFCESLKDISAISDWDVSNAEIMFDMFFGCKLLFDLSCLDGWQIDTERQEISQMFESCDSVFRYPEWCRDKYPKVIGYFGEFEGETFVLNQNMEGDIMLLANDIEIDARGFTKRGGSLEIHGKGITIKNMNFKKSQTAIFNSAELTLIDCRFTDNAYGHHDYGGCICNEDGGKLNLICCEFEKNGCKNGERYSKVYGGAIYNDRRSSATIENCEFSGNVVAWAGAIFNRGQMEIHDSKFIENRDHSYAGAIYSEGDITIENCEFKDNSSEIGDDSPEGICITR